MSWSLRVAQVFGIPIRVHVTFLLVVAWGALTWSSKGGATGALFGVALTLLLFASVALHELGHSVVAQRRGLRVREIVLLPIGGIASLEGKPSRPRDELWIALAGPAVNFVLALGLGAAALGLHLASELDLTAVRSMTPSGSALLVLLAAGNLTLALFNLLPVFPMDGGRVLRALLAGRYGMERGTRWAAGLGQFAAVGMGIYAALTGALFLGLIAVLVFFAAGRERAEAATRGALKGLHAGDVSRVPGLLLHPGDSVAGALSRSLRSADEVIPVTLDGQLVGVVPRLALALAARVGRHAEPVSVLASRAWVDVDRHAELTSVLDALDRERALLAVVHDEGVPVGVLSRDHLYDLARSSLAALGPTWSQRPDATR